MATSALGISPIFNVSKAFPKPSSASLPAGKFSSVSFAKVEYNSGRGSPRRQLKCNAENFDDAAKIVSDITEDAKKNVAAGIDAAGKQAEELKDKAVELSEDAGKKAEEAKDTVVAAVQEAAEAVGDKAEEIGEAMGSK